jgi:hypothetical protein
MKRFLLVALALTVALSFALAGTLFVGVAHWDGAATNLWLPLKDGGRLTLSLYRGVNELSGRTFVFTAKDVSTGQVSRSRPKSGFVLADGATVRFQTFKPGQDLTGSFSLRFAADWTRGDFRARWQPQRVLCG